MPLVQSYRDSSGGDQGPFSVENRSHTKPATAPAPLAGSFASALSLDAGVAANAHCQPAPASSEQLEHAAAEMTGPYLKPTKHVLLSTAAPHAPAIALTPTAVPDEGGELGAAVDRSVEKVTRYAPDTIYREEAEHRTV